MNKNIATWVTLTIYLLPLQIHCHSTTFRVSLLSAGPHNETQYISLENCVCISTWFFETLTTTSETDGDDGNSYFPIARSPRSQYWNFKYTTYLFNVRVNKTVPAWLLSAKPAHDIRFWWPSRRCTRKTRSRRPREYSTPVPPKPKHSAHRTQIWLLLYATSKMLYDQYYWIYLVWWLFVVFQLFAGCLAKRERAKLQNHFQTHNLFFIFHF